MVILKVSTYFLSIILTKLVFPELQIDEVSPSEDERAAESFLRNGSAHVVDDLVRYFVQNVIQLTSSIQEESAPRNVLAQYHRKNHSNKPPELSRLSTAALHQANKHGQDRKDNTLAQESDDEDQDDDKGRAARHSKSNGEAKPDTMAYYKGTPWWAILTKAKLKYRRHIALNHGFPDRDEFLCDAHDILLEEIEEFKGENGILDSTFIYFIYTHLLIISLRLPTSTRNGLSGMYHMFFDVFNGH
jgi:hypothetical protein